MSTPQIMRVEFKKILTIINGMPKVEAIESDKVPPIDYFIIDLLNPKPFDPRLFDELALRLGGEQSLVLLKYIVADNEMFVFPDAQHFNHAKFFEFVMKGEGELQSAGRISLITGGDGVVSRRIGGNAMTLIEWLRRERSLNYRHTVLTDQLGEFFEITE